MNEQELGDIVIKSFEVARKVVEGELDIAIGANPKEMVDGKYEVIKLDPQTPLKYINMAKNLYNLNFDNNPKEKEAYLEKIQEYLTDIFKRDFDMVHGHDIQYANFLKRMRNGALIAALVGGAALAALNIWVGICIAGGLGYYAWDVNRPYQTLKKEIEKEKIFFHGCELTRKEIEGLKTNKLEKVLNQHKDKIMPYLYPKDG